MIINSGDSTLYPKDIKKLNHINHIQPLNRIRGGINLVYEMVHSNHVYSKWRGWIV